MEMGNWQEKVMGYGVWGKRKLALRHQGLGVSIF